MVEPWQYQVVSGLLFMIGVLGVLIRRNVIIMAMCIELMLNAANLSLIASSRLWGNHDGQIFVFMVIVVAAVEVAVAPTSNTVPGRSLCCSCS